MFCLCVISGFFPFQNAEAQNIAIRGIISDEQTGKPLEMANVVLESISGDVERGTATDRNGLYQFSRLSEGRYILQASYVGYSTFSDTLELGRWDEIIARSIRLTPKDENLDDVVVTYNRVKQDLDAGQQKIGKTDLQRVPTPAGGGDLASYLQTLPGVVATGDRGGQLFVRGGTPSENLSLIDGSLIYQPFHIIGFFSVFPEEIVSNVDFYAGGFGPRYSGRTSSVLDVRLRNADFEKKRFSASVSPFLSEFFVEGPIDEGRTSVMVLARGSLIEQASQLHPDGQQPLRFNSQLIKLSNRNEEGSTCSALLLRTFDRGKLDYERGDTFKWNNFVMGGRCAVLSQESAVSFFDINVSLSNVGNEMSRGGNRERSSGITRFSTDVNLIHYVGHIQLDYGFFTNMRWINYDFGGLFQRVEENRTAFITSGAYLKASIPLGPKIKVEPGVSASIYLNKFAPSVEPRLQISWQPREKANEEISAAVGIYRQPIAGVTDLRDAGSAFTAWMPIPETDKQMEAIHALLGWRQPFGKYLDFSVEGYYKWLKDVPVSAWSTVAQANSNLALADGFVYGSDVNLKFNSRYFYSSIGYGYSYTEYETIQDIFDTWYGETSQNYNPAHDRRHQFNAQMGLEVGDFKASITWSYGSGLPFTRPLGFDSHIRYENHLPDVRETYGTPRIIIDKPFSGRMPDYHSLNISLEQAIELRNVRLRVQGGAINSYNQENMFYYDIYTQRRINQLPFYPYISLKLETL
ncbi:MAG: carboxypeptidase-like regulatory domain-containing protein [Balneolaceae bacterium]